MHINICIEDRKKKRKKPVLGDEVHGPRWQWVPAEGCQGHLYVSIIFSSLYFF